MCAICVLIPVQICTMTNVLRFNYSHVSDIFLMGHSFSSCIVQNCTCTPSGWFIICLYRSSGEFILKNRFILIFKSKILALKCHVTNNDATAQYFGVRRNLMILSRIRQNDNDTRSSLMASVVFV